jgi:hypothetical protein
MPWRYPDNIPRVAENWSPEEQRKCTEVANAVLRDQLKKGADQKEAEQQAIFA